MPVALQRLWIQLTADRKKFGVLCAVLAVGLLMWARLILTSNVPRTAVADEERAAARAMNETGAKGAEGPRTPRERERREIVLDARPIRDPFVISPMHFPKEAGEMIRTSEQSKSDQQDADDSEQAAERQLASLRSLVGRFRLEAAMSGAGIGVISGHTARLGDLIPAVGNPDVKFELIEVSHRSVLLRFEDHTFELHMPSPGR